jgi:hypothetical protein
MGIAFKKGDIRRTWFVLGAVATLERPTLTTIVNETGLPKATVNDALNKLIEGQMPGLVVEKIGPVYSVTSWGEIVNKSGVIGYFNACKVG